MQIQDWRARGAGQRGKRDNYSSINHRFKKKIHFIYYSPKVNVVSANMQTHICIFMVLRLFGGLPW